MVKFLVIRFSSIGDIVLTSPLVRCLKNQVENTEIHFLVKPAFTEILKGNPHITKIHELSRIQNETVAVLKEENFDYILDLQNNVRSINIKRTLKRMYFTVDKLNLKKWLLVNFRINRMPGIHIVDRYLATVKVFDVLNDNKGLDYFIPENEKIPISRLPNLFHKGFIVLVMGAKHNTKKLPPEKLIEIAGELEHPLILIGGKEDEQEGELLIAALPEKPIFNGCGKWTINESASVIQHSECVITHDTGMMHIAAAFKKRIITIWGNTIPLFGMYAYQANPKSIDFEVNGLRCRPCSKLGKKSCPRKHFRCMADQDTGRIARAANDLFRDAQRD